MGLSAEWLNDEHQVIVQTVEGSWTLADLIRMIQQSRTMTGSVPHQVQLITLIKEPLHLPRGMAPVGWRVLENAPPNEGHHIIIGGGLPIRTFYNILSRLIPGIARKMALANSLEEALKLLAQPEIH